MTNNLSASDPVGISFWLISMALVAATAFFFIERDRVAGKWKTSLTVSGLVTLNRCSALFLYARCMGINWYFSNSLPLYRLVAHCATADDRVLLDSVCSH